MTLLMCNTLLGLYQHIRTTVIGYHLYKIKLTSTVNWLIGFNKELLHVLRIRNLIESRSQKVQSSQIYFEVQCLFNLIGICLH